MVSCPFFSLSGLDPDSAAALYSSDSFVSVSFLIVSSVAAPSVTDADVNDGSSSSASASTTAEFQSEEASDVLLPEFSVSPSMLVSDVLAFEAVFSAPPFVVPIALLSPATPSVSVLSETPVTVLSADVLAEPASPVMSVVLPAANAPSVPLPADVPVALLPPDVLSDPFSLVFAVPLSALSSPAACEESVLSPCVAASPAVPVSVFCAGDSATLPSICDVA